MRMCFQNEAKFDKYRVVQKHDFTNVRIANEMLLTLQTISDEQD